ncbi:helicase HerA-like domain-containing protein [Maritalea porphyrae]|uniref:helicase HerA-like domain-containing protein n=1 Tax=Maritalea porphyrae TaxID=880732 RepID=UPI0022AF1443|nr:helicase HerA-like domain-containing protein [Maritalea porphyrae]MCZ4270750.1 DUF853 family protein [Maritalea porphyrae]
MKTIKLGKTADGKEIGLPLRLANRHGLVCGATGTGKTVSLQTMAEQFSKAGVPVFAADIKGDLSGIAKPMPTVFWDVFGQHGQPIKTSIQEMGGLVLSNMFNANPTQSGTIEIALKRARDQHDYMLGLDDLRWQLQDMGEERETVCSTYGNVTASSINAIQRNIMALESQDGGALFGEPPFDIEQFMQTTDGLGNINLLHADQLMHTPKLYGAIIFWLLNELLKRLPEVGDADKPKLVFFFDEAHLLFRDAPKHLIEAVERVVRLIRSKGVGVYFVTQSPSDVPDRILAQLGNRIQHALRAYTPKEQRLVKAAASAFRPNPDIDVQASVLEMGVGEALVSTLLDDGVPMPVERVKMNLPTSQVGPITADERKAMLKLSVDVGMEQAHFNFRNRMRVKDNLKPLEPIQDEEKHSADVDEVLAQFEAEIRKSPDVGKPSNNLRDGLIMLVVAGLLFWLAQLV